MIQISELYSSKPAGKVNQAGQVNEQLKRAGNMAIQSTFQLENEMEFEFHLEREWNFIFNSTLLKNSTFSIQAGTQFLDSCLAVALFLVYWFPSSSVLSSF